MKRKIKFNVDLYPGTTVLICIVLDTGYLDFLRIKSKLEQIRSKIQSRLGLFICVNKVKTKDLIENNNEMVEYFRPDLEKIINKNFDLYMEFQFD